MCLKMLGAALIILAAYLMGCQVCHLYQQRVQQLEEILMGLEMFRAEINFGLTPLPEAFQNIGERLKKPVGTLFLDFSFFLFQRQGLSARECWGLSLEKRRADLALKDEQLELLSRLGTAWGQGDRRGQERQVSLVQELLRQALRGATVERQKNEKLWKYLGCMGGITLVLFLI